MSPWAQELTSGCLMCWGLTLFVPFAVGVAILAIADMIRKAVAR